jgi:hypothetical protein
MWLKEAHVVAFCFTWKLTFRAIALKVSQTASWVLVHSLLWVQRKRWTPITSMGCVHTHWRIPAIEGCDNPSHVQSAMEKDGKNNWKVDRAVSQVPALGPEHDKIEHNEFQISCQKTCWGIPTSSIALKMVFVLARTIGDANSSLSCQSLHQSHFLYNRISSDIVTWSKRTGVVPLQRWPWSVPWVFFAVLQHL